MKKIVSLLFLFSTVALGQQKEKLKGSKIVTITQKEIEEFENVEVDDNLEIFLIKGDKSSVEIEADDNLHQTIDVVSAGNTLRLSTNRQISSAKKYSVRVTYTDQFKMLTAKGDANITALADLNLPHFTFKIHDNVRLYANVNAKKFNLLADEKSKTELNLKSEDASIELSKNAHIKALIAATQMKFDMYQKTKAEIEGDVIDFRLRMDNDSEFIGAKLSTKNTELVAEGFADCSINVGTKLILDAKGKSEVDLYGEQKIEIKNFLDNAVLRKKPIK
ncbi:DUF2807 domain-containing protein [Flavobacterium sp. CYK-55]|uniref:GIN domain-containing protein n=1 Tax=Flavobacterium sp. CYK-55 TaxID=2835529 RepID=UPI001BCFD671|nr:DUF2807 domain-containing protein [Flavobacterium sp. CYK-55]MBS7786309.1 DUF2807 domain-containing protein [Flavobacterium sp. CYK-55]